MKLSRVKTITSLFLAAILSAPLFGASTPLPGTLNFVEGKAQIGNEDLTSKSVGSADLEAGQTLSTQQGRAEILLTPGVFLRLDNNSVAEMVSPSITNTKVQLDKGRALLEVAELHKQNNIQITENGSTTRVLKTGLYAFDANTGTVQVFDGKAEVAEQNTDKTVDLKGGRELSLNSDSALKAEKFDKKKNEDDFYNWSALRSEYESEANVDVARIVPVGYGGPGWFWDPWFSAYTFVPGNGIFYSPFGWGFYSPAYIGFAPIYYGGPYRPRFHEAPRAGFARGPAMHAQAFHGGGARR